MPRSPCSSQTGSTQENVNTCPTATSVGFISGARRTISKSGQWTSICEAIPARVTVKTVGAAANSGHDPPFGRCGFAVADTLAHASSLSSESARRTTKLYAIAYASVRMPDAFIWIVIRFPVEIVNCDVES
jgi:hypothetical protein